MGASLTMMNARTCQQPSGRLDRSHLALLRDAAGAEAAPAVRDSGFDAQYLAAAD
jgi:hypothetical protein